MFSTSAPVSNEEQLRGPSKIEKGKKKTRGNLGNTQKDKEKERKRALSIYENITGNKIRLEKKGVKTP